MKVLLMLYKLYESIVDVYNYEYNNQRQLHVVICYLLLIKNI